MTMTGELFSIAQAQGGAFVEAIDDALQECWANILDPNTEAEQVRKVTIEIRLRADDRRELVNLDVKTKTHLAGAKPIGTRVVIGGTCDDAVATEFRNPQTDITEFIDKPGDQPGKVRRIGGDGGAS